MILLSFGKSCSAKTALIGSFENFEHKWMTLAAHFDLRTESKVMEKKDV